MSGFSYPQPVFNSPVYNPAFYLSLDASGFLTYTYAQTLYLSKNDYRLTYITGIIQGTATPGVALVPGTGGDITGIGALSCSSLTVNGSSLTSAPTYVLSITPGTAAASKALVLDSSSNLTGINGLGMTQLSVSSNGSSGRIALFTMPSLASTCNLTIGRALVADQYARINYNYDSSNTNNNYISLGHNSINTLIVSNAGFVGIKQTIPSCELDVAGNQNIAGNLTFSGASRSLSGLTTLSISGTDASTSSSTGAIQCQGGAYFGASSMIASNLIATGLTFGLGSSGSQSLTNNNIRFWGSTLNTQSINLYRASDTAGLVIASTCSTISSNVVYPILNLVCSDNATAISQNGASATSQALFQLDWKQAASSVWSSQTIKHMLDFGFSRNYKSGYPYCHTLATTTDAFCINTLGGTANPPKGCLYLVSGSGSTAPDNIDKMLVHTDTPYSNASYGTAGITLNGNVFIKSNNSFNDGTSSWNMPLAMSNGNVTSELLFAFQMNNGPASTSTTSIVMGTVSSNDFRMMTNNSTRMTITSAGRVGIGITAPLYGLHCTTTATVTIDAGASGVAYFRTSGGLVSTVGPISSVAVGICCSGALVASTGVYCWSDQRLKKDFTPLNDDVCDKMLNIEPLLFRYKTDDDSVPLQLGYRAQDLLKAGLPHCITFHKSDGLEVEDPEVDVEGISYSIEYSKMACLLHKLVLRQQKELNELKLELHELKTVISKLK